jgi:hypothetical protein
MNGQRAYFEDIEPMCTFCGINERNILRRDGVNPEGAEYGRRIRALSRETARHVFWECIWVVNVVRKVLNYLAGEMDREIDRKKYMMGWDIADKMKQTLVLTVLHYIKYCLYVCKFRRIIPTYANLRYAMEGLLEQLRSREKWRECITNLAECIRGVFL